MIRGLGENNSAAVSLSIISRHILNASMHNDIVLPFKRIPTCRRMLTHTFITLDYKNIDIGYGRRVNYYVLVPIKPLLDLFHCRGNHIYLYFFLSNNII